MARVDVDVGVAPDLQLQLAALSLAVRSKYWQAEEEEDWLPNFSAGGSALCLCLSLESAKKAESFSCVRPPPNSGMKRVQSGGGRGGHSKASASSTNSGQ